MYSKLVNKLSCRYRETGFALVEVLLVLSVIAVLTSVVLFRTETLQETSSQQKLIDDAALVITQARVWRGSKTSYKGLTLDVLKAQGMLPQEFGKGPYGEDYRLTYQAHNDKMVFYVFTPELKVCQAAAHRFKKLEISPGNLVGCEKGPVALSYVFAAYFD